MPWAATAVAEEAIKRVGVVGQEFYAVVGTFLVTHGCKRALSRARREPWRPTFQKGLHTPLKKGDWVQTMAL